MLAQSVKDQVTQVFGQLSNQYVLTIEVNPNHESKDELVALLSDVAACSSNVSTYVQDGDALQFTISKNGEDAGVVFRAVPNGHEFTTLLLAVLNLDGIGKNLPDEVFSKRIAAISKKTHIKSYISLSCTNCPDVVQALNIMAFNNPNITHEIIDGAINQQEVEDLGVQAVPTVFMNGEQLHVGRSSLGELLSKIEEKQGVQIEVSTAEKEYDVVVVGGGPAGSASAIYAARKGFSVALVAETIGGQVTETVDIENMVSIPKTTGAELSANIVSHLQDYPIDILENRLVKNIELDGKTKLIKTSQGENLKTTALIAATGASWRKLGVPGETEHIGNGVAFCTHCDGPFYKGKKVVVIGGGNSGLEAAVDLSSIATDVTVLEFEDTLRGDQILQDKLATLDNVTIIKSAQTTEVIGDGSKVTSLKYIDRETQKEHELVTDGVFVQIGLQANSSIFKEHVATNRIGEIEIDAHCRTSVAGIYAAGDVSIVPYKQIIIAMGEGSKAALSVFDDKIKGVI